jgi:hypothetical protein
VCVCVCVCACARATLRQSVIQSHTLSRGSIMNRYAPLVYQSVCPSVPTGGGGGSVTKTEGAAVRHVTGSTVDWVPPYRTHSSTSVAIGR